MNTRATYLIVITSVGCSMTIAGEHDYYKHLRYPKEHVPGIGRNDVEQEGGPDVVGYKRRTVKWWPRKGQDIVDIPEGVPLRVWTRNKGQEDPEALAGVCRNWTASDPETFKGHLVAFRGFGTSARGADPRQVLIPAAVVRMEDGSQRAVVDYGIVSRMLSEDDHEYIQRTWEKEYPKLYATVSQEDRQMPANPPGGIHAHATLKPWKEGAPRFNAVEPPTEDATYPRWGWRGDSLVFETCNFHLIARPKVWGKPANWICPEDSERQNLYRTSVLEFVESFWTYIEASGASMPYWRRPGLNYKYIIHVHDHRAAGGWGHCGIGDCSPVILGHEFFHGQPTGGWNGHFIETMCNSGQHTAFPGELQMFNGNFEYPWRNVNAMGYQSSLWFFVLGDNPNWGHGIQMVAGCLASPEEHTPYHTIARLGQQRGLWKNGIKGFGDFFGEYAARMVTCDFVEQHLVRCKYGMPELSYLQRVYGNANRYRISNAEAPRLYGYNIVRLKPAPTARQVEVDFQGLHVPRQHSDWRACIVAVDARGRARYSPLWNRGLMRFALKPADKHLWLTVAATPSALPVQTPPDRSANHRNYLIGPHAPRYPWEVTLTGCKPGLPHRRQGDIINFDELYGLSNGNTYLNYPVRQEVPIPLEEPDGQLAQEKLAAMKKRVDAAVSAYREKLDAGLIHEGWYESKKTMMWGDLSRRIAFLQRHAKGHRHPHGGGFVADTARVARTAYVGPNAMVLDGATVKDNACIKEFAVVLGGKTVVSGDAKIGGRAWVFGDLEVTGNARILEAATVTTIRRTPSTPSKRYEGQARIAGTAVIKGEHYLFLSYATDQTITGGVVMDYTPAVENRRSGTFGQGRLYQKHSLDDGMDAGALYANWQFNQPRAALLEDSYVNNNGVLHGTPRFVVDGECRFIEFNGTDQYAEAPPSVADFGELTMDLHVSRTCGKGGRLFDFGTADDECFFLAIDGRSGAPTLTALHGGEEYTVTASSGIPEDKWTRIRVELDGTTAALFLDGAQAARKDFAFRPRRVYMGDRPEGNFIACGRNGKDFFRGRVDHFRIYRTVHEDFDALGAVPYPLTQLAEWSQQDQERADDWEARRRALDADLRAGEYGKILDEIQDLEKEKAENAADLSKWTERMEALRRKSTALRDKALKSAHLFGRNPYPGQEAARQQEFQKSLKYHTTADWEDRTPEEVEGTAPEKMKQWIRRVRGY